MSVVELVGRTVVIPAFTHDEHVVTSAEGIWENSNGAEVDVGVVAGGLTGG